MKIFEKEYNIESECLYKHLEIMSLVNKDTEIQYSILLDMELEERNTEIVNLDILNNISDIMKTQLNFSGITLDMFLKETYNIGKNDVNLGGYNFYRRPKVVCNDGFTFSVQGNFGTYSNPKEFTWNYKSMEIGFPSEIIEFMSEYDDGQGDIYAYVPIDMIRSLVVIHGGINFAKTDLKWSKKFLRKNKLKRINK